MDIAQIRHFRHAAVFLRRRLRHRCEHRGHRVVDPDVDGAPSIFDRRGRPLHRFGVGHVQRQHERFATGPADLVGRGLERLLVPRDETQFGPSPS
jgi:hypothetical protein